MTPSRHTSPAPSTTAQAERSMTPPRKGTREATAIAVAKPANIATPPRRGIGVECTSRARTGVRALVTKATCRTTGTVR